MRMAKLADYVRLARAKHYVKNLLAFAALACSGTMLDGGLRDAAIGFCAFCCASSAIYVINDIRDREKDRNHPAKKSRPVASGRITVRAAAVEAVLFLAAAFAADALAGSGPAGSAELGLYLALNLAYSFGLKDVPLADVAILASGFLLRVMYGAAVAGIEASDWLYLTVAMFAFFFALGKRRNELARTGGTGETRRVLRSYPLAFLDKSMYMCLTLGIAFYSLWCMDGGTAEHYGGTDLVFTVPLVLLICLRYAMDVEGDSDGDPVEVLLHDRVLLALCAAYGIMMLAILYL